jgi:hypothetical protein
VVLLTRAVHGARLLAAAALCLGCASAGEPVRENFDNRADLSVLYLQGKIDNGVSSEISFEVPAGIESVLIEVRGSLGRYYLTKFVTPAGRDLIEAGQFVTRGARELPGLVTWMYPNAPGVVPAPGTYRLLIRAEDGSGGHVDSEDLDIRMYLKQTLVETSCGLSLDFLVADDAIVAEDVDGLVDGLVAALKTQYAAASVGIVDAKRSSIYLPTSELDLGGNPVLVINSVGDVMDAARASGKVRSQAVHIMLVRSLGADLRGYSMGLPGPMGSDVATSVVLVSSRAFADGAGILDVAAMAETVAHELGHYLGLYHTSEGDRTFHDPIDDTVECTVTDCPAAFWDNLMTPGGTGRTVLTAGQAEIIRRHPLCFPIDAIAPLQCNLVCEPPTTCALMDGQEACAPACDPSGAPCPDGGACVVDQLGKYICSNP